MEFEEEHVWTREERIKLIGYYGRFCDALKKLKINAYYPDSFVVMIEIYGFEKLYEMKDKELFKAIVDSLQKIK